jgi:hypothetical protein
MPQSRKIDVKQSKPHRRKGHWVSGYFMRISKAFRIGGHKRQPRRRTAVIKEKKTRKEQRKDAKPKPQPKGSRNWRHPFKPKQEKQSDIREYT